MTLEIWNIGTLKKYATPVMVFTSFLAGNEKMLLSLLKTQLPIGKIQEPSNKDALYTSSLIPFF